MILLLKPSDFKCFKNDIPDHPFYYCSIEPVFTCHNDELPSMRCFWTITSPYFYTLLDTQNEFPWLSYTFSIIFSSLLTRLITYLLKVNINFLLYFSSLITSHRLSLNIFLATPHFQHLTETIFHQWLLSNSSSATTKKKKKKHYLPLPFQFLLTIKCGTNHIIE